VKLPSELLVNWPEIMAPFGDAMSLEELSVCKKEKETKRERKDRRERKRKKLEG
jgi:hypothetical protein